MKPSKPLSVQITVQALVARMNRATPRPVGDKQSSIISTAAWICIAVGLAAMVGALAYRPLGTVLGVVFVIAWVVAPLLLLWAVLSPIPSMITERMGPTATLANLADRRWKGVRHVAEEVAQHHGKKAITEASKAVQSEIDAAERRKVQIAGIIALGAAVAALNSQTGLGRGFDEVARSITAAAPFLGVGAGAALATTLGFLNTLYRVKEALIESLALKAAARETVEG